MKTRLSGAWTRSLAVVALVAAAGLAMTARAVDPIPDHKTLVFPTLLPKAGHGATAPAGSEAGLIRNAYDGYYENFWKQTSYHEYDRTTGVKRTGFYIDSKTYGYVQLPWPITTRVGPLYTFPVFQGLRGGALPPKPRGIGEAFTDGVRLYSTNVTYSTTNGAAIDGIWTPGESFEDVNGNGEWDPAVPGSSTSTTNIIPAVTAEDFWNSSNTNSVISATNPWWVAGLRDTTGNNWNGVRGESFADYNGSIDLTNGVVGADTSIELWIYDPTLQYNVRIVGSEQDLNPKPTGFDGRLEGDFAHTYIDNGNPGGQANIPTNGVFDYTVDFGVFPPLLQVNRATWPGGALAFVAIQRAYVKETGEFYTNSAALNPTLHEVRTVQVPIYQAGELYSYDLGDHQFGDLPFDPASNGTWSPGNPASTNVTTIVVDPIPAEPWEDFISWFATDWVTGSNGWTCVPAYSNALTGATVRPGRNVPLTVAEYQAYIRWNYQGDTTDLVARAGNSLYDGPEKWKDLVDAKVWQPTNEIGQLAWEAAPDGLALVALAPGQEMACCGLPNPHWAPNVYPSWTNWWTAAYGGTAPTNWSYGIPALEAFDPNDGNAGANPGANWIPQGAWGYDGKREWCDLPSSMYHLGLGRGITNDWRGILRPKGSDGSGKISPCGDGLLGEVTSPWSDSYFGEDISADDPGKRVGPDHIISCAGPYAINIEGIHGNDAGNLLTFELLTRVTESNLVSGVHPRQFRDHNLDGLIDSGESRGGEANYSNDANALTPESEGDDTGATPTEYPFNRTRYMEDAIECWDHSDDFAQLDRSASGGAIGVPLYGYPIYPPTEGAGGGNMGGTAGAFTFFPCRDTNTEIKIMFQVRPMEGGNLEGDVPSDVAGASFAMPILCHEQGHDLLGWPDLYDYDVGPGGGPLAIINYPIGGYDLMAGGGLVHGIPDMKSAAGWIAPQDLGTILPLNTPVTLSLYSSDKFRNNYFKFANPARDGEYFYFWYTLNSGAYGVVGGPGVYVSHTDIGDDPNAMPRQQRVNNHFTWEIVQADGLDQLQDGVNSGDTGDPFPGTSGLLSFSADTDPQARWWNQTDAGIRILNITLPTRAGDPALVTFQRFDTSAVWDYPTIGGMDTDLDGLADVWEYHYFGDLTTADGTTDSDYDGLRDFAEFLAHTDPTVTVGSADADGDKDSDGISNFDEVEVLGSNPIDPDTDDDGIADGDEIDPSVLAGKEGRQFTSPTDSRSPLLQRSAVLDGTAIVVPAVIPGAAGDRFAVTSWTVEAWVYLASDAETGTLIARTADNGRTNFCLRVDNNEARILFQTSGGATVVAGGADCIVPAATWTHLAGVWDSARNTLELFVNGTSMRAQTSLIAPHRGSGLGQTSIGGGVRGCIDEVRIWGAAKTADQIAINRDWFGPGHDLVVTGGGGLADIVFLVDATGSMAGPIDTVKSNMTAFATALAARGIDFTLGGVVYRDSLNAGDPPPAASGLWTDAADFITWADGLTASGGGDGPEDGLGAIDLALDPASFTPTYRAGAQKVFVLITDTDVKNTEDPGDGGAVLSMAGIIADLNAQGVVVHVVTSPGADSEELATGTDGLTFDISSETYEAIFDTIAAGIEVTAVSGAGDLVAWYPFDDGENTTIPNVLMGGAVLGHGAEDYNHRLNWDYALSGVTFSTNAVYLRGQVDDDLDGIPDWWEYLMLGTLQPANNDLDHDGLSDLFEYYCDTNPLDRDTDNDGVLDRDEDRDLDGLSNLVECMTGTDPLLPDTDDDGILDGAERAAGTDPANSLSPLVYRAAALGGGAGDYVELPNALRFALTNWTVEAWVKPAAGWSGDGLVISRQVATGEMNYYIGVDSNLQVIAGFGNPATPMIHATGAAGTLQADEWAHLSATYESESGLLCLYINGVLSGRVTPSQPNRFSGVGPIHTRVGEGFRGLVKEVRVWSEVRSQSTIDVNRDFVADPGATNLVAYLRFDDGSNAAGTSGLSHPAGRQVEDFVFTSAMDWTNGWSHAATFHGVAAFTNLTATNLFNSGIGGTQILTDLLESGLPLDPDTDGDGMADGWEILQKGVFMAVTATNALGEPTAWAQDTYFDTQDASDATKDYDGDGLDNLQEFRAGLNPLEADTDADGVSDANEDSDGDGVANLLEITRYGTDPGDADTDDDGISDGAEVNGSIANAGRPVTLPLYSLDPKVSRSAVLDGTAWPVPEPRRINLETGLTQQRYAALNRWLVACAVRPEGLQSGSLLNRTTFSGETTFDLYLTNNVPGIRFTTAEGVAYDLTASQAIPADQWTAVMGWWQPTNHSLALYIDDSQVTSRIVTASCAMGPGETTMGAGISGHIDDVMIAENLPKPEDLVVTTQPDFVLILDHSGSMAGQKEIDQRNAAHEAIDAMPANASMAIIAFTTTAYTLQDFTENKTLLHNAANATPQYGTTSYDLAIAQLDTVVTAHNSGKDTVVIMISDGEPVPATAIPTDAQLASLASRNVTINTVGFGVFSASELLRISQATGGKYLAAPTGQELRQILTAFVVEAAADAWSIVGSVAGFYPFDDGGDYAEDMVHELQWNYAMSGITYDASVFFDRHTMYNELFAESDGTDGTIPTRWLTFFFGSAVLDAPAGGGGDVVNAWDADQDPDGDGLNNLYEFLLGYDPTIKDTDGNGVADAGEDRDGDGLTDGEEIAWESDPRVIDSDDDGLTDGEEVSQAVDPVDSVSPYVMRYIHNDGSGWMTLPKVIPGKDETGSRFNLSEWTLEAAVRLDALPQEEDIVLVRRTCEPQGYVTFELGIGANARPYALYQSALGVTYRVESYVPVEVGKWTLVGGRLGDDERGPQYRQLSVLHDTVRAVRHVTGLMPALGEQLGDVIVAQNLSGDIDEVRIWSHALADEEIWEKRWRPLLFGSDTARRGALSVQDGGHLWRLSDRDTLEDVWTVEAWFKTTTPGIIVAREAGTADDNQTIYNYRLAVGADGSVEASLDVQDTLALTNGAALMCGVPRWGTIRLSDVRPSADGQWHYAAFAFTAVGNTGTATLYVDGKTASTVALPRTVDDVTWHLAPNDGQALDYTLPNCAVVPPTHQRATDAGALIVGEGLNGFVDEVAIEAEFYTPLMVQERWLSTPSGQGMTTHFDFDDHDADLGVSVVDKQAPDRSDLYGTLLGDAAVVVEAGENAPVIFDPLTSLSSKLAAYLPFDDGRRTNRVDGVAAVEDFMHRRDWGYAASLVPSLAVIDFAQYTSAAAFDASNPYAGYAPAGRYPVRLPIPENSIWRTDSDGDGMPDAFEQYYGFDPNRNTQPEDPEREPLGDLDGDGLVNLYEYYAGTDPTFFDSDMDGTTDYDSDDDGDGMSNGNEQFLGSHPGRLDTDDDGYMDGDEVGATRWSNPADSMDPKAYFGVPVTDRRSSFKSMRLVGTQYTLPAPLGEEHRFNGPNWTVELWVRLTAPSQTGSLVAYRGTIYTNGTPRDLTFYELGLSNSVPYFLVTTTKERTAVVRGATIVGDGWVHLAAVMDADRNSLGLIQDGIRIAELQLIEEPLNGSSTADLWPGKMTLGDARLSGNVDDFRVWNTALSANEVAEGMRTLVDPATQGLVLDYRFDDGRRATDATTEVADGWGLDDGQGAEDFVHRPTRDNLEQPWQYSLRDIVFDYDQAVTTATDEVDDADGDGLPDWWEALRFVRTLTYYSTDAAGRSLASTIELTGQEDASFSAAHLGWTVNFTPIVSAPGYRWTSPPDAAWFFRDFMLPEDMSKVAYLEIRLAVEPGVTNIYLNGKSIDLGDPSILPADNTFTLPGNTVATMLYLPYSLLEPLLQPGRNRIALTMENGPTEEYFSLEVVLNGSVYLVRRGDDQGLTDRAQARWWEYSTPGSMIPPPADFLGRPWWDKDYALDTDQDIDGDGLSNYEEFLVSGNPLAVDSDGDGISDGDEDSDGDGLANSDELWSFGTNPLNPDTDDDGYSDGAEVKNWLPAATDNYGVGPSLTGPTESISPHVPRSLIGRGSNLAVPHGERFQFLPDETPLKEGPTVVITAPLDGANIVDRFTDVTGTVQSTTPLQSVKLYVNNQFYASFGAVNAFDQTIIIASGENVIEVIAVDNEGRSGSAMVTVNGDFAPADIRVTQFWNVPGDLDTWLVDPLGRHMGWTPGGPGLPNNVDARIPGAFLDIDDIPGTGPENITLEQGSAVAGNYEVWMNNYSHQGSPMSTVRVLVNEGRPNQRFVEFGPQNMPTSDGNGMDPAAWWHTTTVSMPDGTMNPPGEPIAGPDQDEDPGSGITAKRGWTMEAWVLPTDAAQTGAIASYRTLDAAELLVFGLDANRPFVRVRSSANTVYSLTAGTVPPGEWTHLACSYNETDKTIRLFINGTLSADRLMLEARKTTAGALYVDTYFDGNPAKVFTAGGTCIDELRAWSTARGGALIASSMHKIVGPSATMVACYRFDDGGRRIEDAQFPLDHHYDLGLGSLPDAVINEAPGPDRLWGTADDVASAAGADGHNDRVTARQSAPVFGTVDGDADGLPDWWEALFGADASAMDAFGDEDGDGLVNVSEFWCNTNPLSDDTDGNGILDTAEDYDADGLDNLTEQILEADPRLPDTDDDGVTDSQEFVRGTDATDARSPAVERALRLDGAAGSYVDLPLRRALALPAWSIGAWVNPDAGWTGGGTVLRRSVGADAYTFSLEVDGSMRPLVRMGGPTDGVVLVATNPVWRVANGQWTHLSASYDEVNGRLALYVNGAAVNVGPDLYLATATRPAVNGLGPLVQRIGENFRGLIDDVRVWDHTRRAVRVTASGIDYSVKADAGALARIADPVERPWDFEVPADPAAEGLIAYFTFDDGTYARDAVSGSAGLDHGHVQDFAAAYAANWINHWLDAASLHGAATFEDLNTATPVDGDTDGDGLPDWWELAHELDPTVATGDNGAGGDPDGDGLDNLHEYLGGTDPRDVDSDNDGIVDGHADADGDGLDNLLEQQLGTLPNTVDTDDDGVTDWEETTGSTDASYIRPAGSVAPTGVSDPLNSLNPPHPRSLRFDGADDRVIVPPTDKLMGENWTLEAWVKPAASTDGGTILRRYAGNPFYPAMDGVNYELGVSAAVNGEVRPYVSYRGQGRPETRLDGTGASDVVLRDQGAYVTIPVEEWSHVGAVYNSDEHRLDLYVNGFLVAYRVDATDVPPTLLSHAAHIRGDEVTLGAARSTGPVTQAFEGLIDEVIIRNTALTDSQMTYGQGANALAAASAAKATTTTPTRSTRAPVNVGSLVAAPHVPGELLVKFRANISKADRLTAIQQLGGTSTKAFDLIPLHKVKLADGGSLTNKLANFMNHEWVEYAEPNYIYNVCTNVPDDPQYPQLWGMEMIKAPLAWDRTTGSPGVTVAIIDTGIDYSHPDLADNMWVNSGETAGNGIDDDGNGFIDDVYGYNFFAGNGDPVDDNGHGTHTAGTVGAVGNNGVGVAGVNWQVRLMALKFLGADGSGSTDAAIQCIQYAVSMGAQLSNNSWGGAGESTALRDAIAAAEAAGHLFVAAAGNEGTDNDTTPFYPAAYDLPNIIAVAATTQTDDMAGFSNYGATSVDLGAPGVAILSCAPGSAYQNMDGTSMASPHVAGAAALLWGASSGLDYAAVKQKILDGVDPIPALAGRTVTGGRLNLDKIIPRDGGGPVPPRADAGAYFSCNDGGLTVEDHAEEQDWLTGWYYAAIYDSNGDGAADAPAWSDDTWDINLDSDGDAIPDWWEMAYGLDAYDAGNAVGAKSDPDGDGLNNLNEYLSGNNPFAGDSDLNGTNDYEQDDDGDTLSNGAEQDLYGTNPGLADTDDDGYSDGEELRWQVHSPAPDGRTLTSPVYSRSPEIQRSLVCDGAAVVLPGRTGLARADRFNMTNWTVECWVRPDGIQTGDIVVRTTGDGQKTFGLSLDNNKPVLEFTTVTGNRVVVGDALGRAIATNTWTHLAGTWDPATDSLKLYVNGLFVQSQACMEQCVLGRGTVRVGDGFVGHVDELRIWNEVRSPVDIQSSWDWFGPGVVTSGGEADIVFVIDHTGSMGGTIDTVKANVGNFVSQIADRGIVANLGGVRFQDSLTAGDPPPSGEGIFDTIEPFMAWINGLAAGGGGDLPEEDLEALLYALDASHFDPTYGAGSQKVYILVTDAPCIDTEDGDAGAIHSRREVIDALKAAGVVVHVIVTPGTVDIEQIARETGGMIFDLASSDYTPIFDTIATTIEGGGSSGLVAWYPFDDDGATAEDYTHRLDTRYAIEEVAGFDAAQYRDLLGQIDDDQDGIPDWWEQVLFGMPASGTNDPTTAVVGDADPAADLDGDGLNNLYEYYCQTSPTDADTDNDGVTDGNADFDGDGLENQEEQVQGTDPRLTDTDDDGYSDSEEYTARTDPTVSVDPLVLRALELKGAGDYLEMPFDTRFALTNWTVEAWICPVTGWAGGGNIIQRLVDGTVANYTLGVNTSGKVVAGFGSTMVTSTVSVAANSTTWTHVMASFDAASNELRLFVNDQPEGERICAVSPRISGIGLTRQTVGEGFRGWIDEVRVWDRAIDTMLVTLAGDEEGLVAYYRFDDGTSFEPGLVGTSGCGQWQWGQVEDFVTAYTNNWKVKWFDAATLRGNARVISNNLNWQPVMSDDTDNDGMPDTWESGYSDAMLLLVDDSREDYDGDGWDNFSEMQWGLMQGGCSFAESSDPTNPTNYPTPEATFTFRYDSTKGLVATGAVIHAEVFSTYTMNGEPDASIDIPVEGADWGDAPFVHVVTNNFDVGHLRQGQAWVYAFLDANGNGSWDAGEPAGTGQYQSSVKTAAYGVNVDVGPVEFVVGLSDEVYGYPRFAWPDTGAAYTKVTIKNLSVTGSPIILQTNIYNRSYFHEGDLAAALGAGSLGRNTYQWLYGNTTGGTTTYDWPTTVNTPLLEWPADGSFLTKARNEFRWSMQTNVTQYTLTIRNETTLATVLQKTYDVKYANASGRYRFELPIYAGDDGFEDGNYSWTLEAKQPRPATKISARRYFTVDLRTTPLGPYSISGTVVAESGASVTGGTYVVQAFQDGFSGPAEAEQHMSAKGLLMFKLEGLAAGSYYVRAFLDQDADNTLDAWESFGYVLDPACTLARPLGMAVPGDAVGKVVWVSHVDTDHDSLPDAWEYQYFGANFNNLTLPYGREGDPDADGLSNFEEHNVGTNPLRADTDGDGLSDYAEVSVYGSSPILSDTDGDGMSDSAEVTRGTSSTHADSDADGIPDGTEVALGLDPMLADDDNDGIDSLNEMNWDGASGYAPYKPALGTGTDLNALKADTDEDGVNDLEEIAAGSDPLNAADEQNLIITGITVDGDGRPVVSWPIWANMGSLPLTFRLESSTDLVTWTVISTVAIEGTTDGMALVPDAVSSGPVYYRLKVGMVRVAADCGGACP